MPPLLAVEPGSITNVPADDLASVWTVFTKCKGSIKEGRRLENLSWRLWYRELTVNTRYLEPSPFLDSPPLAQPTLSHEAETASETDEVNTDDERPLDDISIRLPTPTFTPSHARPPKPPTARDLLSQRLSTDTPVLSDVAQRRQSDSAYDACAGGMKVRLPQLDRAKSDSAIAPNSSARARRPPSFNLGKMMTMTRVDVAELKAVAATQNPSLPPCPELETVPAVVAVVPPSTPPADSAVPPTLAIIQATPRPTPPDSPQVSLPSDTRTSTTLVVPQDVNQYIIIQPTIPETPTEDATSPATEGPTTLMEPLPVDDPRKKKTFFFKESPGGQHSPNSDASGSTASRTTQPTASGALVEEPKTDAPAAAAVEPPQPQTAAKAPSVGAGRKGKGPVRHAAVGAKPAANRAGTGGRAVGRPAGHGRHHSTAVTGGTLRVVPTRSKSSAAVLGQKTVAAAAAAVLPLALQAMEEEKEQPPKRSASSSKLPPSTGSSTKTVVPSKRAPSLPKRAPSPLKPTRPPSPKAKATSGTEPKKKETAPPKPDPATEQRRGRSQGPSTSSDAETSETELDDDSSWASDYSDEDEEDVKKKEKPETGNIAKAAALEAARQRDMFAKVPTRSYTDLTAQRTKPGLLTSLFHPDPAILPFLPGAPGHLEAARAHGSAQNLGTRSPMPANVQGLVTSKSTAAMPLAAQVTVAQQQDTAGGKMADVNPSGRPGYRLKGRPEGLEVESSDDEDEDSSVPLSKSVAQMKLEALAGQVKRRTEQKLALAQQQQLKRPGPPIRSHTGPAGPVTSITEEFTLPPPSAPIVLPHPYNLPLPAPPATPRTTRRQMFATEVSESLRRQLMWERETNRRMMGGQYKRSSGPPRKPPIQVYGNEDFHATGW